LSYVPVGSAATPQAAGMGAHGLEPWTSALSGLRSSQLSYAPLVKQKSQTMIGLALSASGVDRASTGRNHRNSVKHGFDAVGV
jgi:hypothetical protein